MGAPQCRGGDCATCICSFTFNILQHIAVHVCLVKCIYGFYYLVLTNLHKIGKWLQNISIKKLKTEDNNNKAFTTKQQENGTADISP